MKKLTWIMLIVLVSILVLTGCGNKDEKDDEEKKDEDGKTLTEKTDYAKSESWFMNDFNTADKKDAKADVIFFMGTSVFKADQENGVGDIDETMKNTFQSLYDGGVKAFDDGTRMYIPYYRQISSEFAIEATNHNDLIDKIRATEVKEDIMAALTYYFENYNQGRPFIIAGQSQGGASVQIALEDFFGQTENKKYLDQMVAAYSVSYGVDKNWLEKLDYIDFATGAYDTGVLISWNTEGVGEKTKNFLLAENPADTLVINPINWKTDETYASASICSSSLVDGVITEGGKYNLQIDLERGSVICDNCTQYVSTQVGSGILWGGKSLHTLELALAFGSIRDNMHDRIDAYLTKSAKAMDYSVTDNWLQNDYSNDDKKEAKADVFFIYGTEAQVATQSNGIADLTEELKVAIKNHGPGTVDCFDDGTRMYIPYYRQVALATALNGIKYGHTYLPEKIASTEAYLDLEAALDYYFANCNEGRPFILAGYSQGGACVQVLLEKYFGQEDNKKYLDQLVAAYSIAYGVDKTWLEKLDYIDFATGVTDTGVLLSWVTEGVGGVGSSMLVADDPANALVINPINWMVNSGSAKASECVGTYVSGEITSPGLYNLAFSKERGCLICDNNTNYIALPGYENFWGGTSLHVYEVTQAYASIRENMHERIESYYAKDAKAMDYSVADNWLQNDYSNDDKKGTKADVFFIYGTEAQVPTQSSGVADLTEDLKTAIKNHGPGTVDCFDDDTRMYIPYYRQVALSVALNGIKYGHNYLPEKIASTQAYLDLEAALDYYFENCNEGRPFILAGYSQGGACVQVLLEKYFGQEKNKKYLDQLVAAYSIAYGVDKTWLEKLDYIDFATGATDTGVLLSWVTEGVGGVGSSMLVANDPQNALVINPINWMVNSGSALASECAGTYVSGEIVTPGLYNLAFSKERGCLICDNNTNYIALPGYENFWGGTSLHVYEVTQAYASIRQNMHARIDAYLKSK